jgi:hypothetical protein
MDSVYIEDNRSRSEEKMNENMCCCKCQQKNKKKRHKTQDGAEKSGGMQQRISRGGHRLPAVLVGPAKP